MTAGEQTDVHWMQRALSLADRAAELGEVPVGAVVVREGIEIGAGFNRPISTSDPSAHAEMVALRAAALGQQNYRLPDTTLYVTMEPCPMCLGAIVHARVKRVVFGAADTRWGAAGSVLSLDAAGLFNHDLEVSGGVLAEEAAGRLKSFFKARRR